MRGAMTWLRRRIAGPVAVLVSPVLLVVWVTIGGGLSSERRIGAFPHGGSLDYSAAPFRGFPKLRSGLVGALLGSEAVEPRARSSRASVDVPDRSERKPVFLEHASTNDDFADAIPVPSVPFTARTPTAGAGREGAEPATCSPVGGSVWYRYDPSRTVGLIANTFGSDHSTALAVFQGRSLDALKPVACDADVAGNSQIAFAARAGERFYFQIGAPSGGGALTFNVVPQGTTSLVSASSLGEPANSASSQPSLSADGRFVSFLSGATNLVPDYRPCVGPEPISKADRNRPKTCTHVYLRDRVLGHTEMVSVSSSGEQANSDSFSSSISSNGRFVVFKSDASNLVEGDSPGSMDVFVRDRVTGITEIVSVSTSGEFARCVDPTNFCSEGGAVSDSGRFVVFHSHGDNLVEGDTNEYPDVFLRDRHLKTTTRVSVSPFGDQGDGSSFVDSISPDGRLVVFRSWATNLEDGEPIALGPLDSIYVQTYAHDRISGSVTNLSLSPSGARANGGSEVRYPGPATVSADNRYVVFRSWADNLVANDENIMTDVFVRDRARNITIRASVSSAGEEGTLDYDWNRLVQDPRAYAEEANEGESYDWSISADGRYVAFSFLGEGLVPDDTNHARDIFVRDLLTNTTVRVSVSSQGEQADDLSWASAISGNGRVVAFASHATTLVAGLPLTGLTQIFVHER